MGLFDWLLRNRHAKGNPGLAPPENYPTDEKRILLRVAKHIKSARGNPLNELMAVTLGLGSAITALRRHYGQKAVEANCPAEQLIGGFADGGDHARAAQKLLDDLLDDPARSMETKSAHGFGWPGC